MQRMNDAKDYLESNPIETLTTPSNDCPFEKCDGKGWIWYKDWSRVNKRDTIDEKGNRLRAEWMEKCDCFERTEKQREIDKKLDLSGIPPIFKDATVGSFDVNKYKLRESREVAKIAKTAAANYVQNYPLMKENGKGLYFYSGVKGSGKTRLASSIANALVKMYGVDIAFIKAPDLMNQVRKTFKGDSETTEAEIVATFRKVEVLIVDDLALKESTEFEERILYDIVDYRMENNMPTIFTSNVTALNLEKIYKGGRVNQRIKKMAVEIYMPEESIREAEAKAESDELERILLSRGNDAGNQS